MSSESTLQRVIKTLQTFSSEVTVHDRTPLPWLQLDSLDQEEACIELEKEFDLTDQIPSSIFISLRDAQAIADWIEYTFPKAVKL